MNKKLIFNAVGFNVVWFAWAFGVPAGQLIVPAFLSILFIAWHIKTTSTAKQDGQLIAISFIAGLVFDSALQQSGLAQFVAANPAPLAWLQPWWMCFIWIAFACTLNHSMAWLGRLQWFIAALLSGVFGYLSYAGAAKLGALNLADGYLPILVLFVFWALFIPLTFYAQRSRKSS